MNQSGQSWFDGLQRHISTCRQALPIPSRDDFSEQDEWQCRIIGSSLINWLNQILPFFFQERLVVYKIKDIEPDPYIIFTSSIPGLAAAREITKQESGKFAFLLDSEFEQWTSQHPDPLYCWHIHVWSAFRSEVAPEFLLLAKENYPIAEHEIYWQHSEGTMWAELAGRGGDHLWKWDGESPTLLEEAFTQWVT